ncbi:hypothetical protein HZS_2113 [Henneguya salminicola]|nr:hypothetical protein HZS_2113 [Henneguya salminicola]
MPVSITVDFEPGLLNACKQEFTESKIIGCYFHLKQALSRRLKKVLLQEPNIYLVLKLIKILKLVPKEEINDAIDFINFKLGEKAARFSTYCSYFSKKRLKNHDPE